MSRKQTNCPNPDNIVKIAPELVRWMSAEYAARLASHHGKLGRLTKANDVRARPEAVKAVKAGLS